MCLPYARAYKGQRVSMPKPFNRGSRLSLIGAISTTNVEAALYGEWATNGTIFQQFLTQALAPKLSSEHVVLMDNIAFHKNQKAIDIVTSTGAKVDFLPPYSPEFNPIEMLWSFIKTIVKKYEPRNFSQMKKALTRAFQQVDKKQLLGWYQHAGYRSTQ